MSEKREDLTGQTFNHLYVERFIGLSKSSRAIYETRCLNQTAGGECGNKRQVRGDNLKQGAVKECRTCSQRERKRSRNDWYVKTFYAHR